MNYIAFLFMMFIAQAPQSPDLQGNITLIAEGFHSDQGEARVAFYDSGQGFPNNTSEAVRLVKGKIRAGKAEFYFKDIPFGKYAISLFHDENSDRKMNKNLLGIPKEGYGFSNNAKGFMGPPSFEDAAFEVNSEKVTIRVRLQYE